MPGLANALAAGRPASIDWAYYAVCWCFIALGTFCVAHLAMDEGRSPFWGLLFLITPATLAALERMTVDVSLTALIPAALLAARRERWLLLWVACAGSMLAKETGVLLIIAVVAWFARQRRFRFAAALSSSLLPAAAWYVFVQRHTGGDYSTANFTFTAFFAFLTTALPPGTLSSIYRIASAGAAHGVIWIAIRCIMMAFGNRFHDLALLLGFLFCRVRLSVSRQPGVGRPE